MTRIGVALTSDDLPRAELCAMRLDGEVVGVDEWFISIDTPDSPSQRAATLSQVCEHRFIVEQASAAWVWGLLPTPPQRHELCSSIGARARSSFPQRVRTREVVIDDSDWVQLGAVRVTTPLRTLLDHVRFADEFNPALTHRLCDLAGVSVEACRSVLMARRNLPGKKRALERLTMLTNSTASNDGV